MALDTPCSHMCIYATYITNHMHAYAHSVQHSSRKPSLDVAKINISWSCDREAQSSILGFITLHATSVSFQITKSKPKRSKPVHSHWCVYIYMCIYIHYIYIHTHTHTYLGVFHTHIHTHTYIHTYLDIFHTHTHRHTNIFMRVHAYAGSSQHEDWSTEWWAAGRVKTKYRERERGISMIPNIMHRGRERGIFMIPKTLERVFSNVCFQV